VRVAPRTGWLTDWRTKWLKDKPPAEDAVDIVVKLKRRMIDHALPLWSKQGWDPTTGGFIDRLDQSGRADRGAAFPNTQTGIVRNPATLACVA